MDRKLLMTATADIGAEAAKLLTTEWTGKRIVEIKLDPAEQAAFDKSCASVQELIDASRKLVG